jgi:hypothetical protein
MVLPTKIAKSAELSARWPRAPSSQQEVATIRTLKKSFLRGVCLASAQYGIVSSKDHAIPRPSSHLIINDPRFFAYFTHAKRPTLTGTA